MAQAAANAQSAAADAGQASAARKAAVENKEAERKAAAHDTGSQAAAGYRCGILGCDAVEHPARYCQHNEVLCELSSMGPAAEAAGEQLWNFEKALLGLGQLDACKGGQRRRLRPTSAGIESGPNCLLHKPVAAACVDSREIIRS